MCATYSRRALRLLLPGWLVAVLSIHNPIVLAQKAQPLKTNEVVLQTRDRCGVVVNVNPEYREASWFKDYKRELVATYAWSGACVDGLAMGEGFDTEGRRVWMYYGRQFGYSYLNGKAVAFSWDGTSFALDQLRNTSPGFPNKRDYGNTISDGITGTYVRAVRIGCFVFPEPERPADCTLDNDYDVYFVEVGGKIIRCPQLRSPVGCDAIWRSNVAPLIDGMKAFVAENEPKADALKEKIPKIIAQAEEVKRVHDEQARLAEDERQRQAAAEERKSQDLLARGNPGQLFALADKLNGEGKADKAREALRALIARFPRHPLAVTAAEQLSALQRTH